jgi:hypothetical protein
MSASSSASSITTSLEDTLALEGLGHVDIYELNDTAQVLRTIKSQSDNTVALTGNNYSAKLPK